MKRRVAKKFTPKKRDLDDFGSSPGSDDDVVVATATAARVKEQQRDYPATPPTLSVRAEILDPPSQQEKDTDILSVLATLQAENLPVDPNALPDPVALINKAISADLDPSVFTEQQFAVAPNVIEWCRGHEYLGNSTDLFPKQIQILAHFFSDFCHFCSDLDYVYDVPVSDSVGNVLDRFSFLEHGVCPRCKRNRVQILSEWQQDSRFWDHHEYEENVVLQPKPPNEFVGVWGQRSGKSYTISTFAWPYILHRYLSIPNPPRYFNRPSNIVLEAAFVAPTLHQVNKYMWMPFREAYEASPWFRDIRNYMTQEGKRIGVQLYHSGATFLIFPGKRIAVHMLAANSSNLRGGTRIFASLDELGWFNTTEEGKRRAGVKDGTEVFNSLSNSLVTIRSAADKRRKNLGDFNVMDAYMVNISSPSSVNDPIMLRAGVSQKHPRMYYTHYKTWEVNPDEEEDTIRVEKSGDEESFLRDFCAIPPRALSPFIPDFQLVQDLVQKDWDDHLFTYDIEVHQDEGLSRLRPVIKNTLSDMNSGRVLTIDNGETNNAFALCIARYLPEIDGLLFEEFLEVAPYRGHHVDLAWCYNEVVIPLIKIYDFIDVGFDRWNSAFAVHDLRTNLQVNADRYSLKWKDFDNFREDLRGMRIWFPQPETSSEEVMGVRSPSMRSQWPRAHFQMQLTTVNQFGKKVYKPEHGNDDLFRVAVLAHHFVQANKDEYRKRSHWSSRNAGVNRSSGAFRGNSRRGGAFVGGRRPSGGRTGRPVGRVRTANR